MKQCNPAISNQTRDPWLSDPASRRVWLYKKITLLRHLIMRLSEPFRRLDITNQETC